jgi:hypothetical protein
MVAPMTKRRERWARAALVLGAMVAALAVFELGVRVFGVDYNLTQEWKFHRVLGWSQVPGGRYDFELDGRAVHVEFNAIGFRDDEHTIEKPPGVRRIVVIGDSFSEAVQVNVEETFYRRLVERLNATGRDHWELINLGVGDFGSAQELIALERYGLRYAPDIVIQQIFALNDVCTNSIELVGVCRSENDRYRPYLVGDALRETTAQPVRNFLRRWSAAYGVVEHALGALTRKPKTPDFGARVRAAGLAVDPLLQTYAADEHQEPVVRRAWTHTEAILAKTAAVAHAHGAHYLAMTVPFELQLDLRYWPPGPPPPYPLIFDYAERRLEKFFARVGEPVVTLLEPLAARYDEIMPYINGHLSSAGHRVAADALYKKLVKLGWVKLFSEPAARR